MPVYQYQGVHYDLPDGLSNDDALGKIKAHLGQASEKEDPSFLKQAQDIGSGLMNTPSLRQFQAPASIASGMAGQMAGGWAGLTGGGADAVRKTQEALTYQPRDEGAQAITENLGKAFNVPIDIAGEAAGDIGRSLGNEALGETLGSAGMETALNFMPLHKAVGMRPKPGEIPPAPRIEPAPAPQRPIGEQMELPLQNSAQQAAEMRGATQGQPDLFGPQNIPRADIGPEIGPRPVPEPIDTMSQHRLFDMSEDARLRNPTEAVTGDWRVDENGIPIKADLSMEAANLENPLQRNLWGDELPRKHEQEAPVPLTEAIDAMPNLPWESPRSVGIDMLSNGPIRRGPYSSQRGAVDLFRNNASGESSASLEAQGRLRQESALDRGRFVIRANGETMPLVGVDGVDYVPKQGEVVVQKNVGKDTYTVLDNNGVKNTQAAVNRAMPRLRSQSGSAPWINDLADAVIKAMGGKVDSGTMKTLPPSEAGKTLMPEQVQRKIELRNKTNASATLKRIAPEYSDITSPEEAIASAQGGKDINSNIVRDQTISGINGQVMLKRNNPVLNYTRYELQTARNKQTKFSKDYVTGKDGVATNYSKMSVPERVQAVETLREAAVAGVELDAAKVAKMNISEKQKSYILSVREGMDAMWDMAADALQMSGRDAFTKRAGYLPNMFTGSYKSLVGTMVDGVFKTSEVVQADTRAGHRAAVKAALVATPGSKAIELPRVGLKQMGRGNNSLFNGFNDIINTIAQHDPRFAELQMNAQMKINEANHKLMNFDVHELKKKGVKGAVGDVRGMSREQNASELGKALINYLEQGAEYYTSQEALNNVGKVLTSPDVDMPNAKKVAADHIKHVTGQDLNPIGAALNWTIDGMFKAAGVSPKIPLGVARELKTWAGIHMMGLWNPTFTALQLTQVLTGAMPEMMKVGGKLGMTGEVTKSATTAPMMLGVLKATRPLGIDVPKMVPQHLVEAYDWAHDHGIMDFSELEIAHSAAKNKGVKMAEKIGALPISIGESMTRPPVFMVFADIFHKFGLDNDTAFRAAQHATNISMGDYHPAERPKIYAGLGLVGEFGGALTTYKHNMLTNLWNRGNDVLMKDQTGSRYVTPAIAALATASLFQGVTGMPGFDEADAIYQWATGMMGNKQGITETALHDAPEWSKYGYLSASTGLDFQSRASMSRILPELKGGSLSPQLSVLADVFGKAWTAGKFQDQQSFNDLAKAIAPAGLKGAVEDAMFTDKQGYVSNAAGELMNDQPRTEKERLIRKMFAIRPLRETVESKDVFIDAKSIKEKEDAQKEISRRFRQAFAANDQKGMDRLAQVYYDKEGDPQTLLSDSALQDQIMRSNQSQRERMTGKLEATMKSINRYRDMNDGR